MAKHDLTPVAWRCGRFLFDWRKRTAPVVMGILTIGSALTLVGNLVADVAYAWADPRIRRGISN